MHCTDCFSKCIHSARVRPNVLNCMECAAEEYAANFCTVPTFLYSREGKDLTGNGTLFSDKVSESKNSI